jgi:hypothetical protein
MKLKNVFSLVLVGALVVILIVLAPGLRADGGPPSGVFTPDAPAQQTIAPDNGAAGIAPKGTKAETVTIDQPTVDVRKGDSSGLISEGSDADQPAALEQPVADPKAAGLETR